MPSNLIAARVPLVDPDTGLVSREWFNFFQNLFNLTGGGQNDTSILDMLVAPPSYELGEVLKAITSLTAVVNGLTTAASDILGLQQAPLPQPRTQVITQCGNASSAGGTGLFAVVFPAGFNTIPVVVASPKDTLQYYCVVGTPTITGFTGTMFDKTDAVAPGIAVGWIAVGT